MIAPLCRLPQNYLFGEQPQLARWDKEAKVWRTGGFQDILFDFGKHCYYMQILVRYPITLCFIYRGQDSDIPDILLLSFGYHGGKFPLN